MDEDYVAGGSLLAVESFDMEDERLRDAANFELLSRFLDFELLVVQECGVTGQECQLARDLILDAPLRHALGQRIIFPAIYFLVVFATAGVAGVGRNSQLRLDLPRPHHDRLAGNQTPDVLRRKFTHRMDVELGSRPVSDIDLAELDPDCTIFWR